MNYITIIAVFLAFVVKGLSGFANTLVFNTIMSFTAGNINITPMELLIGYPSNLYIAWRERKGITLKVWLPLALFVIIGIIPGTLILMYGDTSFLKTLFGFVVILLGLEMLLRERQKSVKKSSRIALILIGVISGVLCGLFGVGAFLVAYISRTTDNMSEFKSNICIVFFIENTFRIIIYTITGIFTLSILKNAVIMLPVMAAGLAAGILMSRKMSERAVKRTVIVLLMLSGISLIINNLPF
jgi:uncharacterized membrane protein YfcA